MKLQKPRYPLHYQVPDERLPVLCTQQKHGAAYLFLR